MDSLTKLKQAIELTQQGETVDILPLCREHLEDLNPLMDQAIEWDLLSRCYQDGYLGLKVKVMPMHFGPTFTEGGFDTATASLEPDDVEPDCIFFQKDFRDNSFVTAHSLQRLLAIILLSDCTSYCNALEAIKINSAGLIAYGTYYS